MKLIDRIKKAFEPEQYPHNVKCVCGYKITVPKGYDFVNCPNCHKKIYC